MQQENQNGATAPQVAEGDRYLLVRLTQQGELTVAFNDFATGQMLHKVTDIWMEAEIKKAFKLGESAVPPLAVPGIALDPRVLSNLKKRGIGG